MFLAIMAIASGMAQPELYSTLSTGAIQAYGNWLMIGRQQSFGVSSGHDHDHRLVLSRGQLVVP